MFNGEVQAVGSNQEPRAAAALKKLTKTHSMQFFIVSALLLEQNDPRRIIKRGAQQRPEALLILPLHVSMHRGRSTLTYIQ
jgi:hypothetical protein